MGDKTGVVRLGHIYASLTPIGLALCSGAAISMMSSGDGGLGGAASTGVGGLGGAITMTMSGMHGQY